METFALAAVSLTIAVSLLIKKKKDPLHRSYAVLCLVLAFEKGAFFFYGITTAELLKFLHATGMILLAPLLVHFARRFIGEREALLSSRVVWYVAVLGILDAVLFFVFHGRTALAAPLLYGYVYAIVGWCFAVLAFAALKAEGIRKKRLRYVLIAVAVWGVLSISDSLQQAGFAVPALSEIGAAVLVYFVLIVIVYPKLPELYEIMARATIIFVLVLFVAGLFYAVAAVFGNAPTPMPDFNLVLMASFLIVIFIDPVKLLLKRAVSRLLFEGRAAFTSLFALDDEVEKEKSLFLEEMARGMAHEIRNPLGSIKGAAQYLKTESESEETRQLLTVITEETDRLEKVVSRFLSYANPYVVNAAPRDVNVLVERALSLIRRDEFPESISIVTDFAADLPLVEIDEEQCMQVIFNIVLNALEAMPEGGTLTLSTALLEDERMRAVNLTIRDTGGGIPREAAKQLFKPFFTTKKHGTGLGLAICRKIISEHGGYIRVSSHPGKGSAFHVILPVE